MFLMKPDSCRWPLMHRASFLLQLHACDCGASCTSSGFAVVKCCVVHVRRDSGLTISFDQSKLPGQPTYEIDFLEETTV